jgi:hypothetical protein
VVETVRGVCEHLGMTQNESEAVPTTSRRAVYQVLALGLAVTSVFSLASSIVQAVGITLPEDAGMSDRLVLLSRVVGTPFAVLLSVLAILALYIAHRTDHEEARGYEIATLTLASVVGFAVLLGSLQAAVRVTFGSDLAMLAVGDDLSSRIGALFQYISAIVLASITLWMGAGLWRDVAESTESNELAHEAKDADLTDATVTDLTSASH